MTIDSMFQPSTVKNKPATVATSLTLLAVNQRHPLVKEASRKIDSLHKFVMSAHVDHLIEGAVHVRERLKILYAAQRAPSVTENRPGMIRALLVQSQTKANWEPLIDDGAVAIQEERQIRHTLNHGDLVSIRAWLNPTKGINTELDDKGKRVPLINDIDASRWIIRVMKRHGCDIDVPTLTVGEPRKLPGYNKAIHLRPYQFQATVTDPAAFANAMIDGVGAAKAYGAGLLHVSEGQPRPRPQSPNRRT